MCSVHVFISVSVWAHMCVGVYKRVHVEADVVVVGYPHFPTVFNKADLLATPRDP